MNPIIEVHESENLEWLSKNRDRKFGLIYIDPLYNTGNLMEKGGNSFIDSVPDYIPWLMTRINSAWHLLNNNGAMIVHVDPTEGHYVKCAMDRLLGRKNFLNQIIWSYNFGNRPKDRWPSKHDMLFIYVRDPKNFVFNVKDIDRLPYKAGRLQPSYERVLAGQIPTDVWQMTIVPTVGKENLPYPTQKPKHLLRRLINAHSSPGDWVLDFFAGSGTSGEVCQELDRNCVLIDNNPHAISLMKERLNVQ